MQFWTSTVAAPTRAAAVAQRAEAEGWDGVGVVDSQNLSGDPYICLALGATATETLGLQTSVTNPVTRHAAVTASSAMSVQRLSGGRMVLAIGRGDSALAHLGMAPARLRWFERYLANVQAYLQGAEVPFDAAGVGDQQAPPVANLGLADAPSSSSIRWAANVAKVPAEVAATGERVIGIAARHADRILFALGAIPERIAWGIDVARQAAAEAGRDADELQFGAYVNVVCHDDPEVARTLGRASTSLFARFSVLHGKVSGPVDESQAKVLQDIYATYDMNAHAQAGGKQTEALTDDFMHSYAILGGVDYCAERLRALAALGIEKFAVTGPNFTARSAHAQEAAVRFAKEVLPELQRR